MKLTCGVVFVDGVDGLADGFMALTKESMFKAPIVTDTHGAFASNDAFDSDLIRANAMKNVSA